MQTYVFVTPKSKESKDICGFIQNTTIIAKNNSIVYQLDKLIRPQYGSIDFTEMPLSWFCEHFNLETLNNVSDLIHISPTNVHISYFNVVEK